MQPWSPLSAAVAAAWEMDAALDVLWDWIFFMAPMTLAGPAA